MKKESPIFIYVLHIDWFLGLGARERTGAFFITNIHNSRYNAKK